MSKHPDLTRSELIKLIAVATQPLDLQGVDLNSLNLEGLNLTGANLRGANLNEANLSGANLQGADLNEANLSEANLSNYQRSVLALELEQVFRDKARANQSIQFKGSSLRENLPEVKPMRTREELAYEPQ